MEQLKPFAAIAEPDPRSTGSLVNRITGERIPLSIERHHAWLAVEVLGSHVRRDIQDHFATAKNLLLYSWFVYRFIPVAQMHLYSCLEFALRDRLGLEKKEHPPTLRPLIRLAFAQGLLDGVVIRDRHLQSGLAINPTDPYKSDAEWFVGHMAEYVSFIRNNLAHGAFTLMPDGGRSLRMVRDVIDHVYTAVVDTEASGSIAPN
jgi:hypothetical protein